MSNDVNYTIGDLTITLILNGKACSLPREAPNAPQVIEAIRIGATAEEILDLLSINRGLGSYSGGQAEIKDGNQVWFDGQRLPKVLEKRILSCYRDDVPFENLLKFFGRLSHNPSSRAVEGLYEFMETCSMPITPDGKLLGYKGVGEDYYSLSGNTSTRVLQGKVNDTGHIHNDIGAVISVERSDVSDDPKHSCAKGLHVGSMSYAIGWGYRVIIVAVDPANVVCIPEHSDWEKLRCCEYEVISDFHGEMSNSGVRDTHAPYDSFKQAQVWTEEARALHIEVQDVPKVELQNAYAQGEIDGLEDGSCDDTEFDPDGWERIYTSSALTSEYHRGYTSGFFKGKAETSDTRKFKRATNQGELHAEQDQGAELESDSARRCPATYSSVEEEAYIKAYLSVRQ